MQNDLHIFSRTEMIIGTENLNKLRRSRVVIFGVGGVGSFVAEALVRSGVGSFVLIDNDSVALTNVNRQIHATKHSIGQKKVEVMKKRMLEINEDAEIYDICEFVTKENAFQFLEEKADYVVDAIDNITAKIAIIEICNKNKIPIISSMGTGNKMHPERLELADIYQTSVCPLAKVMRKELKKREIPSLKVCYSREEPITPLCLETTSKRQTPGSISFVPSVAGLIIAGQVVRDLINFEVNHGSSK